MRGYDSSSKAVKCDPRFQIKTEIEMHPRDFCARGSSVHPSHFILR